MTELTPQHTALLVDDDSSLADLITTYLKRHNFAVTWAESGKSGLRQLQRNAFDCVILDVMLPGEDGFQTCKRIRSFSDVPILMLTARGELSDRVLGLEIGADDYLAKPFEPRELVARLGSLVRRSQNALHQNWQFGELSINTSRQMATLSNRSLDLTTTEFELLCVFAQKPGRVLTREQILDSVRGSEWSAVDRAVDIMVSRLRHKLGDSGKASRWIKTVWGTGYVFIGGSSDSDGQGG